MALICNLMVMVGEYIIYIMYIYIIYLCKMEITQGLVVA